VRYRTDGRRSALRNQPSVQTATGDKNGSSRSTAERLARLRLDVWRAALLGTLAGAALVIGWIELIQRVCL
jgi:hypothetical protein